MIKKKIVIAIKTAYSYLNRRELVRNSWLKDAQEHPDVAAFFVQAVGTNPAMLYDDTLFVPGKDEYFTLLQKHKHSWQYILDHYDFDYVFSCDDDTYVHIPRLVDMVKQYDYIGDNHGHRCRAWFKNGMHDYAHGGSGYLMSPKALAAVVATIPPDATGLDDMLIGRMMIQNGIKLQHDSRFQYLFDRLLCPRPTNNIITIHYVNSPERLQVVLDGWK